MTKAELIGQRYDLVRACLSGGVPEKMAIIDELLNYIATGDRKVFMNESQIKEEELSDANKEIEVLEERLRAAKEEIKKLRECRDVISQIISTMESEHKMHKAMISAILEDVDTKVSDGGLSVKEIANNIGDTNGKVYVEFGNAVYKVTAIYAEGSKRILQTSKEAFVLTPDNGNGVKKAVEKNLEVNGSITAFRDSVYRLRRLVSGCTY